MKTNEIIREFIVANLASGENGKNINDNDSLIASGIVDSMGIINLLGFLEERFSIEISSDELLPDNFESILAITKMLENKINP